MGLTKPRAYQIYDIDYKQAVRVVTTTNITLTAGAPNSVDGVTLSLNDRVLVTGQSTGSQNGIYYVTTLGTGANGTWSRAVDGDATGEILAGMIIMVTEGTTYADTQWKLTTNDPIVIGTTALTFVLAVQANLISSGSSNVVVNSNANVTISSAGTANVLTISSTGTVTTGTASVTANITGGNLLTSGLISAAGNVHSTYYFGDATYLTGQAPTVQQYFFSSSASDISPYYQAQYITQFNTSEATSNSSVTVGTTGTLIQEFLTTSNYPGLTTIAPGQIYATFETTKATGTKSYICYWQLYKRTAGGTETLLITSDNSTATAVNTLVQQIVGAQITQPISLSVTDRLAVKIYGYTSNGTDSITITWGDNTDTGFFLPAPPATISQFVPYNNATSNLNLGSYSVLTTGIVSGTGNVTGGNLLTDGLISSASTVTGTSHLGSVVSASSNITGGNLITAGIVTSTGNIISVGNVNAAGASFTGNVAIGNVFVGGYYYANGAVFSGGGAGGTPSGSNTNVQFNDNGVFGGNGQFTYDKVTNILTAGIIYANNNGNGTNFKVGDDVYIGDINIADTMSIRGQQNAANGYIVFGNADATGKLGRAGTGPLTYAGAFSATGNVTGGNILTGGLISATSTVTGTSFIGAVASSTTVSATGNITGGNVLTGGLISSASTVTGTSHLGSVVSVSANITGGNILTGGIVSATGNITGSYILGNGSALTGLPAGYTNANLATVGANTFSSTANVTTTANITGGNLLTGGLISATSTITGSSFSGAGTGLTGTASSLTVGTATTAGTVTTAAQPNITSVGTLSSLTVTANITGGNLLTGGLISSASTVTGTSHLGTVVSVSGNITGGNVLTAILYTNTGNTTGSAIVNSGANGVGNIGSATGYFNTAHVKATSAQYADLAEMYVADNPYQPGTVLEFGGEYEVTITTTSHSTAIAGIVSTNPSYLMNSCQDGEHVVAVALTGRVPCQVQGPVKKGDVLVASNLPGVAQRIGINWQPGCVIGKAMEIIETPEVKVIEVAVGRL